MTDQTTKEEKKENPLINIAVNIVIPSVVLTKLTKPEYLGFVWGFVLALIFPLLYGIYDLSKRGKVNFFSIIGLANTLLTGGIGLLELDKTWMIVKETAIPLVIGIVVLFSRKTKSPLVKTFLNQIIDLDKVREAFSSKGLESKFDKRLNLSSDLLGGTFFVSAFLNYVLAVKVITGAPGSQEFAASVADMLKYSFPVITIPMMIMVGLILYFLFSSIQKETDLEIESIMRQ